jgi:hypothetical protein
MRIVLDIVLFAVFFNIAAVLIAATGFFPTTLYSDAFGLGENPETLPTYEVVFNILVSGSITELKKLWGLELTVESIMTIAVVAGVGVAFVTRQTQIIAMALIGYVFWNMYLNSRSAFNTIAANMDVHINYIALMIALGIAIMFIVVLADYASGQRASSKT